MITVNAFFKFLQEFIMAYESKIIKHFKKYHQFVNALKYIPLEVGLPALNNSVLFYEDRQINELERHLKFRYFKPLAL